ncbi:hypothetical protein BDK51DRAFT_45110 [Blyttiomyces helicus]|uniref:Uncharacterized protein n=1 Tax=Blyttiomyces helicus TaxID=388810 RepID=A0A4P9VZN0_9FUNG|nr:hypothetical protein BDK51DRAFT_45110 [Blyttiomyces helicus]|eukprot:RKO84253.1 hypothetical protein BDK51DRAFT_45110 [Blyttiomyces helicus]
MIGTFRLSAVPLLFLPQRRAAPGSNRGDKGAEKCGRGNQDERLDVHGVGVSELILRSSAGRDAAYYGRRVVAACGAVEPRHQRQRPFMDGELIWPAGQSNPAT